MDMSDGNNSDDDNDDINSGAYEYSEDAGLVHLVHAWIQQNQPQKVRVFFFFLKK